MMNAFKFLIFVLVMPTSNANGQSKTITYPVVVAFNSIGTGVPSDAPLLEYISCFKKSNKIKSVTASRIGPLGREGEYKLAFPLTEMNKTLQDCFITGIKETAKKMNERGAINVEINEEINFANLPARAAPVKTQF